MKLLAPLKSVDESNKMLENMWKNKQLVMGFGHRIYKKEDPRSDIINFEAKVFPGINLFWLGSCTMLLGFFVAYWHRYTTKNA